MASLNAQLIETIPRGLENAFLVESQRMRIRISDRAIATIRNWGDGRHLGNFPQAFTHLALMQQLI
jgi:hypothetical protein